MNHRVRALPVRSLSSGAAALLVATHAIAQCTPQWQPSPQGATNNSIFAFATLPNGDVIAGGAFTTAGGVPANRIARWDGTAWSPLDTGVNGPVFALATLPDGSVVAGGLFTTAGGISANRIARWDGSLWAPLDSGLAGGFSPGVYCLAVLPNGDLVAGGSFTTAGSVAADRIARWNGNAWSPLGSGLADEVRAIAVLPDGALLAAGAFLNAGGVTANHIARWDGTSWSGLGNGLGPNVAWVRCMTVLQNGHVLVGGDFPYGPSSSLVRWNGSGWSAFGPGIHPPVASLATLPNGDVAVGHDNSFGAPNPARVNGSSWTALGASVSGFAGGEIYAMNFRPDGELLIGGGFATVGGQPAANFARYRNPCAATAVATGAACQSSGSLNAYAALDRPWIGTTYHARGNGLPRPAVLALVTGFSSLATPLAAVLPLAPAGCLLLVNPDVVAFTRCATGTVDTHLEIPNSQAIVGMQLHQQVVAFEIDPIGNLASTTSTNAITATVGTF